MKKDTMVIVRTYSAGVHYGHLSAQKGREVVLKKARRIWYWRGANTLHEMSLRGVDKSASKVSEEIAEIKLTEAIEIIPCAEAAVKSIAEATWK